MTDTHVDVYAHPNRVFVRVVCAHGGHPEAIDVSCWNGTLGRVLIREAHATVDRIEPDAEQAQQAREYGYRRVDVVDLDRAAPAADGRVYDFLLFDDVVEHTVHPERVPAALTPRLKPGGRALPSLPNIAFAANRLTHLLGRWDCKDYGILDRTRLRFFTRRPMVRLAESAGLRVVRIDGYFGLRKFPWFVREPLPWLACAWPSHFAIQAVLEAVHASAPPTSRD